MKINIKNIIYLLLAISITACHKDVLEEGQGETMVPSTEIGLSVNGEILGYVYDEQGDPVVGASVSIIGATTTTDQYGVFIFKDVELDQNGTFVKVNKPGYIFGSDMIYATEDVKHTSRIHLYALDGKSTINSSVGGTVEIDGGGQVLFSANSISSSSGDSYSGEVVVTAKRISTGDRLISDKMPGALVALDSEGRTVVLGSMGMIAVELRDPSGNELNLKEGSTAEVIYPILPEQQNYAPEEIPLWSFDEEIGIWKEEGVATKSGSNYIGSVSHFSFWNWDVQFPLTSICGRVLYDDGSPAEQVQIQITTDGFGVGWAWTNADGTFGGKVPLDQVLQIKVNNTLCDFNQSIAEIEVGPFSEKTTLDDITIPLPSEGNFSGRVVCSGDSVAEAVILYSVDGFTFLTESGEDGAFSVNLSNLCGDISDLSVFAIDPNSGKASLTQSLDINTDPNIELEVCNNCSFAVEIAVDPSVDSCLQRIIMANVTGDGNYSYLWSDGNTSESIQVVDGGQYCVTVTDSELSCSTVLCSEESSFAPLSGVLETQTSCNGADGTIRPLFNGGTPPYTYEWSEPNIVTDPIQLLIGINVPAGTYSVTVTDTNGCSIEVETTVKAVSGFTANIESEYRCYAAYLTTTVTGGQAPYSYIWDDKVTFDIVEKAIVYDESGNYCVEITDANGCTITQCIDVIILDDTSYEYVDISYCDGGLYTFTHNSLHNGDITLNYNNINYTIAVGKSIQVDMIAGGFGFPEITITNSQALCSEEKQLIPVPQILPLSANQDSLAKTYTVSQKTCPTCDDGGVTLYNYFLFYTSKFGANQGRVLVLDADYTDVTTQATGNELASGTYFVVVTDNNTGCYIFSERIVIE